jgi:hypothetical protein
VVLAEPTALVLEVRAAQAEPEVLAARAVPEPVEPEALVEPAVPEEQAALVELEPVAKPRPVQRAGPAGTCRR